MPIERAAAWVFYDPKSDATSVILRMKYNNHPEYGEILGSLAAREFQPYHFFREKGTFSRSREQIHLLSLRSIEILHYL